MEIYHKLMVWIILLHPDLNSSCFVLIGCFMLVERMIGT